MTASLYINSRFSHFLVIWHLLVVGRTRMAGRPLQQRLWVRPRGKTTPAFAAVGAASWSNSLLGSYVSCQMTENASPHTFSNSLS